jgi:hypothetical protein
MATLLEYTKIREIGFDALHPDPNQAQAALTWLVDLPGIHTCQTASPLLLIIQYDIRQICLEEIEDTLRELGLHLDNGLLSKLKRALYHYSENNERINLDRNTTTKDFTREVFISRYLHRQHGCRDHRPKHWRDYR